MKQKEEVFYINDLTGEKKTLTIKNIIDRDAKPPSKFKLKERIFWDHIGSECELYKAKNKDMIIQYQVAPYLRIKNKMGLYDEFLYGDKLIVESRKLYRKKGIEVIIKLEEIDTLKTEEDFLNQKINQNRALLLGNQHIELDSIGFEVELPDIFVMKIENGEIISLNQYKDNGKYLLIDFWGTWCKPCIAAMPELRAFYDVHRDQVDLLSLNYKDSNIVRVKRKIEEIGMNWEHAAATEKVNIILNPETHFPGLIMFDDKMRLLWRHKAKEGLELAKESLKK